MASAFKAVVNVNVYGLLDIAGVLSIHKELVVTECAHILVILGCVEGIHDVDVLFGKKSFREH